MTEALDVARMLDPEIAAYLAGLPFDIGSILGGLSDDGVAAVRELFAATEGPEPSGRTATTVHELPGAPGASVRVHRPVDATGPLPCVVWMHGGGLVLGTAEGDDARFDRWCPQFGCVGVSIGYRLAPETPYPGPLDDCYAALSWVHDHADDLGIDPSRIGIGGASAGGGLAAGLGLLARDRGEVPVAFQLLGYPMIDDRQVTTSSTWIDPVWPPSANTYGWTAYLGAAKGTADVPIYAAAARATDLAGLPPDVHLRRRTRRLQRRGHRLCRAPAPRRGADRAARLPRRAPRLRRAHGDDRSGRALQPRHGGVAGGPTRLSALPLGQRIGCDHVVRTMSTSHDAAWSTASGTLPRTYRPAASTPRFPTTITSAPTAPAMRQIMAAGSPSDRCVSHRTPCARARCSAVASAEVAIRRCSATWRSSAPAPAADMAAPGDGAATTSTTCSSAPESAAHAPARSAAA